MLNEVNLIGHLGSDPEIRAMSSGDKVANFSIATTEKWKNRETGAREEKTQWHRIVVWSQGLVGVIEQYLKKGEKVYIKGQLETRKWEKDGVEHYVTEVVLRNFNSNLQMLSPAGEGGRSDAVSTPAATAPAPVDELEDEIPFN